MRKYIEIISGIIRNRNLVPKLGSIVLAVILWAYISSTKSGNVKFKIPVSITGLEENLVISKMSHKVAVVEMYGNKDDLKNITSRNIRVFSDLSKAEPGAYKLYPLQYQKIDIADDYKIELYPEEVRILVEKKTERDVMIIPRFKGVPEKGFMTGNIRISPDTVKITGPVSMVNNIGVIYTEDITVDDKNASFHQDVKIVRIEGEGVGYSLSKVDVTVPVIKEYKILTYEIPVVLRNRKKGFKYLYNPDRVIITIADDDNRVVDENLFTAYIDAAQIDIDIDEFITRSKIEAVGSIRVEGENSEADNSILSVNNPAADIVVTKE